MRFDELDAQMRPFETSNDLAVLPEVFMVARLDGRNFTRLVHETHRFAHPFDGRFRDLMVETAEHLMTCGFKVLYAYTQSDEISLLFHRDEVSFNRKLRKLNSVLAGEASGRFSVLLGDAAAFDCRISQLPNAELVVDYFRWRAGDAHRNALNAYCYWTLRDEGMGVAETTSTLTGMPVSAKNELLFQHGINVNAIPVWQRHGVGLYWQEYEKDAVNRKTGEPATSMRRRIVRNVELPMGDAYGAFLEQIVGEMGLK